MSKRGLVFNIQRYSIHDGQGIRTMIFFKGCPLACPWCSNPESRGATAQETWLRNGVEENIGEWKTADELVKEVMKDEIFFRTSGGGVTLSGGEILMQHEFVLELLQRFVNLGVHTAIETTGCFPKDRLASLLPYVDQILFDLKIMDEEMSKSVIRAHIDTVKENFELAIAHPDVDLTPRIPLIPGFTAEAENVKQIIGYLKSLGITEAHLLPFHQYGSSKYEYLGWEYEMRDVPTLTSEEVEEIRQLFVGEEMRALVDGLE